MGLPAVDCIPKALLSWKITRTTLRVRGRQHQPIGQSRTHKVNAGTSTYVVLQTLCLFLLSIATTAQIREGFIRMCACTEPAGADVGALCVQRMDKRGRKQCWITHTLKEKLKPRHPTLVRSVMMRHFSLEKPRKKILALRVGAPHCTCTSTNYRQTVLI